MQEQTSAETNDGCYQETQRLMQEPVPGISAVPDDNNARYFHVVVAGPEGSPFEGGVFKLELFLPEDYPMSAPKVSIKIAECCSHQVTTHVCTGEVHHSYLPPQYRQAGQDLSRHPQGQVEPRSSDQDGSALYSGAFRLY